jgi:hypothetical protein
MNDHTAGDGCVAVFRVRLDLERVEVHTCNDTDGTAPPVERVWTSNYVTLTGVTPFDVLTQTRDHVDSLKRRAGADIVEPEDGDESAVQIVTTGGVVPWTPVRGSTVRDGSGAVVAAFNGVSWVEAE